MQINPYLTAQIQQQARTSQKPADKRQQVERLRHEENVDDKHGGQSQKQNVRTSEGAIERLEQQNYQQNAFYDQSNGKKQQAVAAYNSVNHQAERENVQQMLGVDLFA